MTGSPALGWVDRLMSAMRESLMNKLFGIALVAVAAAATPAQALVIASDISATFSAADPTQLGRLSRDGVPSDWSTSKAFPGVINAGTSYRYQALTINF